MLPFVTVGILVVCAFCAISVYNGYTEKFKDRKEYARTTIRGMEADIYYLQGKLSEDEIRQKYNFYHDPAVRIMAADGTVITGDEEIPDGNMELLYADSGNFLGWRLEYWMDKKSFEKRDPGRTELRHCGRCGQSPDHRPGQRVPRLESHKTDPQHGRGV